MTGPLPRAVPDSELAVLATVIWQPGEWQTAARLLADDDWFLPLHADLWRLYRRLMAEHGKLEQSVVHAAAVRQSRALADLFVNVFTDQMAVGGVEWHAKRIVDAHAARATSEALQRGLQRLAEVDADAVTQAEQAIEDLRLAQRIGQVDRRGTVIDVHDLVGRPVVMRWAIKDLLGRNERLVLTAPEGYGKSTMLRQLGYCAASGLHPFRWGHIEPDREPARVYVFDAENPAMINTVEYGAMWDELHARGLEPKRDMLHVNEAGASNLLDPRQAAELYSDIERLQPDLIVIGPLYQLHEENPNDEGPARKLSAVLDRARAISGAAMVLETHTPHSDGPHGQIMRPFGASLWKRWPEFGYCLHADPQAGPDDPFRSSLLTPWRGARARRQWPRNLIAGGMLPWGENG